MIRASDFPIPTFVFQKLREHSLAWICAPSHYGFRYQLPPVRGNPPRLTGELSKDKRAVAILNPLPDGKTHTSRNRARRHVKRGVARWGSEAQTSILFVATDHRCISAARSARETVAARKRLSDGSGFATLDQVAGLPVIKPVMLLLGKPTAPPGELPQTVPLSSIPLMVSVPPALPYKWPLPRPDRFVADFAQLVVDFNSD